MLIARQSTARTVIVGPVLDADGVAVTGGVVADFKIAKNGGAPAGLNGSATLTHRHTGFYSLALTASDLDTVGQAEVTIDDTVNACQAKEITVIEEAVYDALFAASATGIPTANENADALLGRNVSGGSSTGRLVKQALHFLRNKWSVSGGTLTVYDTDDTTSSWTATVSSDAAADPITGNDPS
jgi:hypothetical protein